VLVFVAVRRRFRDCPAAVCSVLVLVLVLGCWLFGGVVVLLLFLSPPCGPCCLRLFSGHCCVVVLGVGADVGVDGGVDVGALMVVLLMVLLFGCWFGVVVLVFGAGVWALVWVLALVLTMVVLVSGAGVDVGVLVVWWCGGARLFLSPSCGPPCRRVAIDP